MHRVSVKHWVLKVQVNGEWEECRFPTRHDALSAFVALANDYKKALQRAILVAPGAALAWLALGQHARPMHQPVN